ncbi:ribonuclease III [bacterium]|nr:ribonuclease III [bacterium]
MMKIFRQTNEFEKIIGYKFSDESILVRALTHPSIAEKPSDSYQRLEFLGDALLDFIVGARLFKLYPDANEGKLTEMRRILVNSTALANIAKTFDAEKFVIYDNSLENFNLSDSVLCDIYESIVGAIYLDGGLKSVGDFISRTLFKYADILLNSPKFINFKGQLLELLQSKGRQPRYIVLETTGPPHNVEFTIGVYDGDELLGIGVGSSKKDAEQNAANKAVNKLKNTATH